MRQAGFRRKLVGMDGQDSAAEPLLNQSGMQGLKHFKTLLPLFQRLHEVGCRRDKAGNRGLFFDGYCALTMLYLFNPLLSSMKALQQAVQLPKVAKAIGVKSFSTGSFSEAPRVFELERLKEIIQELAGQAKPLELDPKLKDLKAALTLVDSTVLGGKAPPYSIKNTPVPFFSETKNTPVPFYRDVRAPSRGLRRGEQRRRIPGEQGKQRF